MMTRRLWVPLLVALLVAALVGPTGVTAVEPRTVTAKIMIPAAAFVLVPHQGDYVDYANNGDTLQGNYWWHQSFLAPVEFPVPQVTVRSIALYAYDHDGTTARVCASLYRSTPAQGPGQTKLQTKACTAESPSNPQVAKPLVRIANAIVNTGINGSYLRVDFDANGPQTPVQVFGVQVTYVYEAGA